MNVGRAFRLLILIALVVAVYLLSSHLFAGAKSEHTQELVERLQVLESRFGTLQEELEHEKATAKEREKVLLNSQQVQEKRLLNLEAARQEEKASVAKMMLAEKRDSAAEGGQCPSECLIERPPEKGPLELVGFISVRIYENDVQHWRTADLVQWLHYMRWAGVQKMLVCDFFILPRERQKLFLAGLVESGYVVWEDWSRMNPRKRSDQMACYAHGLTLWGSRAKRIIHFDMDEYPVVKGDSKPGFLVRAMERLSQELKSGRRKLGGVLMPNIGFVGPFDRSKELVIDWTHRRTKTEMNHLIKPVLITEAIGAMDMHTPMVKSGYELLRQLPPDIYMAHFWGPRYDKNLEQTTEENHDLDAMRDNLLRCKSQCSTQQFPWVMGQHWDDDNKESNAPPQDIAKVRAGTYTLSPH